MGKKFEFGETAAEKTAEEIRSNNQHRRLIPPTAEQNTAPISMPVATTTANVKPKKSTNGIVIDVPMQVYVQLAMMKMQTGRPLKDLALQAILEFVERNSGNE